MRRSGLKGFIMAGRVRLCMYNHGNCSKWGKKFAGATTGSALLAVVNQILLLRQALMYLRCETRCNMVACARGRL